MAETTTLTWFDRFRIVLSLLFVASGVIGFYRFPEYSLLLRTIGVVVVVLLAALLFFMTTPGRRLWQFMQEARLEMRKVVWPNRQEVMQATMVIVAIVAAMGLFFWTLDSLFFWGVNLFIQS